MKKEELIDYLVEEESFQFSYCNLKQTKTLAKELYSRLFRAENQTLIKVLDEEEENFRKRNKTRKNLEEFIKKLKFLQAILKMKLI